MLSSVLLPESSTHLSQSPLPKSLSMRSFTPLSLSLVGLLSAGALAQEHRPFPMRVVEAPVQGVLDLAPMRGELSDLAGLDQVIFDDVALPGREALNLELSRVAFDFSKVGVYVDGRKSSFDPGNLSIWKGSIEGLPETDVLLSLSSTGCYGWINDGVTTIHLTSMPGADGTWQEAGARWVTAEAMNRAELDNRGPCMVDELDETGRLPGTDLIGGSPASTTTLELKMAIETDYQLYQLWNDLTAEQNYVMALLAASSDRYNTEINVVQTFPYVQFYTNPNDPWTSQDNGGSSIDLLYEFQGAWAGNIPAGAHLAAFLSGASLGGGVAWLDVLCNSTYGFSVSGNINGGVTFPVTQGSNTWDFMVFTHETGHNVGTPHTHDYCPPPDECAPSGYFGQCQTSQVCITNGTIMSYCHLCPGGMSNITTYFHPTVKGVMRTAAENSCLPNYGGGPQTLFSDGFESGDFTTGGWTTSSSARCKVKPNSAYNGSYGAKLKKGGVGTGACTVGTDETWIEMPTLDTTGYSTVDLTLWAHFRQNELSCEYLDCQYWDGSAWVSFGQIEQHSWASYAFTLPAGAAGNPALRIRFQTNAKGQKERAEIDDVVVTATP